MGLTWNSLATLAHQIFIGKFSMEMKHTHTHACTYICVCVFSYAKGKGDFVSFYMEEDFVHGWFCSGMQMGGGICLHIGQILCERDFVHEIWDMACIHLQGKQLSKMFLPPQFNKDLIFMEWIYPCISWSCRSTSFLLVKTLLLKEGVYKKANRSYHPCKSRWKFTKCVLPPSTM